MNSKTRIFWGLFLSFSLLSINANPFVFVTANGSLPIKIAADSAGETWKLPNGEYVTKLGGEPTMVNNGITIDGTTVKSQAVNVNLESVKGSEISYENGNGTIAKENWIIKESDKRIEWDSFSEKNLILTDIPISETVGGYTVTDYKMRAVKEKTMNNIFGSLWIQYKVDEGKPLKHTLNFTASNSGTFKLCQEFSEFDFDEIKKFDSDSGSEQIEDVLEKPSEKIDLDSLDVKSKSSDFDLNIKSDPLLLLPEVVEFKKGGKLILGEITSGAKQDFQSFEYDSISKTVLFCYGDFNLKSGESFLVDPDTYSSNNPTVDGFISSGNAAGAACNNTGTSRDTTSTVMQVLVRDANLNSTCKRAYVEWDISSIPSTAVISNTVMKYDVQSSAIPLCDYMPFQFKPSTDIIQNIWKDIGNGTAYVANDNTCASSGDTKTEDLGSSADSAVQSNLSAGWFAVGMKASSETRSSGSDLLLNIESEESGSATPKPTLEITYSIPTYTITYDINSFNGTALPTASIVVKNTTNTNTYAVNSTGMKLLTGISGNQNITVSIPVTGGVAVVNKTLNYAPSATGTKTINANIYAVNCVQTGSSADVQLIINQTIGHTVTNMTRPVCSTANNQQIVISTNMTFTKDGTTGASLSSLLFADILNMSAFGKNATSFLVNGSSIATSLSGNRITSSLFTVGQGINTYLVKFYLWLDATPQEPTGLSATSASVSQINLSWTAPSVTGVGSITGYKITRGLDGVTFGTVVSADTGTTGTTYSDTGLAVGVTYYYKVQAINSYGAGTASGSASAAPTAASSGGSSTGGGGGGTITNNLQQLSITLVPKTGTLFLGETKTFDVEFTYDLAKSATLKIQSLVLNSGNYDSLNIVPEQIPMEGKIVKDGKGDIKVTVHAAENDCAKSTSATCVNLKPYVIQLAMLVQDANGGNQGSYPITLEVSIIDQPKSGTIIILFVIALIIGGGSYGAYENSHSKKKPMTPKRHEKEHFRAIKNAQNPLKKPFFKKLFK